MEIQSGKEMSGFCCQVVIYCREQEINKQSCLLGSVPVCDLEGFVSRIPRTIMIPLPRNPAFRVVGDCGHFPLPKLDVLLKRPVDPESPSSFSSFQWL